MSDRPTDGEFHDDDSMHGESLGDESIEDETIEDETVDDELDEDGLAVDGDPENGLRGFESVGRFLEEDGWHPQQIGDNFVYRVYFAGQNGELACFAQVRVDLEQFLFYVVMPVRAPEERRLEMAEFITRANYGLRIGNFEMDFEDGEVRYKASIDFEGEALTDNLIRGVIYPAVQTMDRYLPGLLTVTYGGKTPEEAVADIEADVGEGAEPDE